MGEELTIGGCCVRYVEELENLLLGSAANTLMRERVVGGVEDAVAGRCGRVEDAGGLELLEIADVGSSAVGRDGKDLNAAQTYCSRMSRTSSLGMRFFTQR